MPLLSLSLHLLCPLPAPALTPPPPPALAPVVADSLLAEARAALERGQAWRATWMLAPVLADPATRTPEAVLLAAQAARGWEGWDEVHRLLVSERWLDRDFDGEGRALLARAALERNANEEAVRHGRASVALTRDAARRGERQAILARALDRLDSLDAAAGAYAAAAEGLPRIADWLVYRAAIVTTDRGARDARFASLTLPVAQRHLPAARADGALRAGDSSQAAVLFDSAGDERAAWRLRAALAGSDAARAAVRADLLRVLETRKGTADGRSAAAVLDEFFAPLDARTQLAVARALANGGPVSRAAEGFRVAAAAGLLTERDHYDHARQLFALGRYEAAAREFARVRQPAALAASAAYQRGRALVRAGELGAGRAALRALLRDHASQTDPASTALYLLGDLATDEGRDGPARDAFRTIVSRHPRARLAPTAAFKAAIIAFAQGQHRAAAEEFDAIITRFGTSSEANAARYWAGRAWAEAGDQAAARERWRAVAERDRTGYYGARAAARLGDRPWAPPPADDRFEPVPGVDSALARAALLERLGMGREARWELDAISAMEESSGERLIAAANALRGAGHASRGIRMTWRALERGAPRDARAYRLLYPIVFQQTIDAEADAHGVDPAFAAALIRQESMFTPAALSPAGARGLMQVMPTLGRSLARARDFPVWDPVLLFQSDVNLQLGMAHLAELLEQYDAPVRVLAAYNAGGTRVARWADKAGAADPELFAERIPYVETRDYVRIIQRNEEFYRALYRWSATP